MLVLWYNVFCKVFYFLLDIYCEVIEIFEIIFVYDKMWVFFKGCCLYFLLDVDLKLFVSISLLGIDLDI